MEPPATLNDYFGIVDDFFKKTFREDSQVFLAIKSKQCSETFPGKQLIFSRSSGDTATDDGQAPPEVKEVMPTPQREAGNARSLSNFLYFSPRLAMSGEESVHGKMKVACGVNLPHVCRFEQNLLLHSNGVVASAVKLRELVAGLTLVGKASVNTIAPASQDVTAARVTYERSDFYSTLGYQRNGLGSSNLLVDCGTKFFNLLAGAGFERQRLSYLEQGDGSDQIDVLYAGVGFSGVNWSVGAKMIHANDAWSTARVAMYQKLAATSAVACAYHFDLASSQANVSLGFSQGFTLRVPNVLGAAIGPEGVWIRSLPFVGCIKGESNGTCAATIRGVFNNVVHWGLVAHKNMLLPKSPTKFGLILSMESD